MSKIINKKINAVNVRWNIEVFDSAQEVVRVSRSRKIADNDFYDMYQKGRVTPNFCGVKSMDEALHLLSVGYQPTVAALKEAVKVNLNGSRKRVQFYNDVAGYQPIVPLALMGVPCSMVNSRMTAIKAKVIDVFYDMTANSGVDKDDIIKAGQKMLGAIMELESQGYKFNLYAIQSYSDSKGADILCTKVKGSNEPLDIKRISFPMTHPAYFRVIGFDWYSKVPGGKHRFGYGHGVGYEYDQQKLQNAFKEIFGRNAVYFACANILNKDAEYLKNVITGNDKEA